MTKKECSDCTIEQPKHKSLLSAINRISGQLNGIARMIEEDRYCPEIMNQIRAARAALGTLENKILRNHLQSCLRDVFTSGDAKDQETKIEEIVDLFQRY